MKLLRSAILFSLFFTALPCFGNVQTQLEQMQRQYERTLQERSAQFSPQLKNAVQNRCRNTIKTGAAKLHILKKSAPAEYEKLLCRIFPQRRVLQFLAARSPSGSPLEFNFWSGFSCNAVLAPAPLQRLVKTLAAFTFPYSFSFFSLESVELPAFAVLLKKTVVMRI